jgi:hypothetical protein
MNNKHLVYPLSSEWMSAVSLEHDRQVEDHKAAAKQLLDLQNECRGCVDAEKLKQYKSRLKMLIDRLKEISVASAALDAQINFAAELTMWRPSVN